MALKQAPAEITIDKLLRSRRRSIGLEVTRDARLIVRAPIRISLREIKDIVLKKRNWILKKQAFVRRCRDRYLPGDFIDGENYYYLGRLCRLGQAEGQPVKGSLAGWYRAAAYEKIKERADRYAGMTGLAYSGLKISNAGSRLGSCSAEGNLSFSWRLIMVPLEIIDYVVVHELAHLEVRNHSGAFWDKVRSIMPDYKPRSTWLKENNAILHTV